MRLRRQVPVKYACGLHPLSWIEMQGKGLVTVCSGTDQEALAQRMGRRERNVHFRLPLRFGFLKYVKL